MKKVIIIPGLTDEVVIEPYERIAGYFKSNGFDPAVLYPDWTKKNTKDWVSAVQGLVEGGSNELSILGFSMGAMVALLSSTVVSVDNLILCSPSGYFKEYAPLLTDDDMTWALENITDFQELSAKAILKKSHATKSYLLAGDRELKEWKDFRKWIGDIQRQTNWDLKTVKDTGHEIESEEYQDAVSKLVDSLK